MDRQDGVAALMARGVRVMHPDSVYVAPEVRPERIAPGVVLHPGVMLRGADLSIGPGCEIGGEGPVVVEDCALSHNVRLAGGYFSGSVFWDGASAGSGAHVRPGCLLEEEANVAHTVGLKQTILFPFVTGGSLLNFCDVLMAGGTSRRNHGEIGSSYIHFNFTPHQDKATASLIGDVPRGVRLDQPPVFLGGQGGLVGPVRIEFGTVVPAGCIVRRDLLEPGRLHVPAARERGASRPFVRGWYRSLRRIVRNGLIYIGNVHALRRWYEFVRTPFAAADPWRANCVGAALRVLDLILEERVKRLREVVVRVGEALRRPQEELRAAGWNEQLQADHLLWYQRGEEIVERAARAPGDGVGAEARAAFLAAWAKADPGQGYTAAIRSLPPAALEAATAWLQAIVDAVASLSPWAN